MSQANENRWTFLTHHGHAWLCLARRPDLRIRELAQAIGITESAAQRIVRELAEGGCVVVTRRGRRNHYQVVPDAVLRHPLLREAPLATLLRLLPHADAP